MIRPQGKTVSRLESKPEVLEDFYQHGIEQMKEHFGAMQDFLEKLTEKSGTILTGSGMYCKDCKNMGEFMLVERFYPDEYLDSTYSIDFAELAKKGYRGVLFDIDNTLDSARSTGRSESKSPVCTFEGAWHGLLSDFQQSASACETVCGCHRREIHRRCPQTIHEKIIGRQCR